jgi:hypothetical protein
MHLAALSLCLKTVNYRIEGSARPCREEWRDIAGVFFQQGKMQKQLPFSV